LCSTNFIRQTHNGMDPLHFSCIPTLSLDAALSDLRYGSDACSV